MFLAKRIFNLALGDIEVGSNSFVCPFDIP
jgi:hypothetical protein